MLTAILSISAVLAAPSLATHTPILDKIIDDVQNYTDYSGQNKIPAVIFDLDETLIDSRPRMLEIFQELSAEPYVETRFREEAALISKIKLEDIVYSPVDNLKKAGIENQVLLEYGEDYYKNRYFTGNYLVHDQAFSGAQKYVRQIIAAGAHVFYITGRNEPNMGDGTRKSLRALGFPLDENASLILKPKPTDSDANYKKQVFESLLDSKYEIIAGFENEPRNLNFMGEVLKTATLVFMNTMHSNLPDTVTEQAWWIQSYN